VCDEADPLMNATELRATICLAAVFAARLLGLFMIYPVFAQYAQGLPGATPEMIGLALGAYGLTQGVLQIPLGVLSDRIARKWVISAGLAVFGVGSVVAALATTIEGVLLGRILQGAGAVGSTILALVADLTRDEMRTRAMAVVGITIGLSFALAVLVGPPLAAAAGLSGVFWITAGLAVVGIGVTLGLVPTPARISARGPAWSSFLSVLRDGELLRLDLAVFVLHAILTASFLVIPTILSQALEMNSARQWEFYLPVLVASVALMIPAIIVAETRGRMKEVFVASVAVIAASLVVLAALGASAVVAALALTAFFTAFNALEAMLPSLITKFAPADAKGAATGVYSSAQFLGIFAGGAGGGWMLERDGAAGVFGFAIVITLIWLAVALTMRRPALRRSSAASGQAPEVTKDLSRAGERT
jgi:predicted MFS family arabinose efflux permease